MTDEIDHNDSNADLSDSILARLSTPSTWEPAPATGLDAVFAELRDESPSPASVTPEPAAPESVAPESPEASNVIDLSERRNRTLPFVAGVAAGLLVPLIIGLAIFGISRSDGEEVAAPEPVVSVNLEATELAPEAIASIELTDRAAGTRIQLDVSGLPPAAAGTYYEAWIADSDDAVSTGTFHLRGGDDSIVLWAGVPPEEFDVFAITIQDIGEIEGSDLVVLAGELP